MPHRRITSALLAATLLLVACGDDDDTSTPPTSEEVATETETETEAASDAEAEADAEPEPEAPAADQPGPYAVGRSTQQVTDPDRPERTLTVEVWYPAAAPAEPTPYELIPGVEFAADLSTVDAPPSDEAPFPVLVFSHGSGGLRQQSATIVETVASHGFVVVAADHAGNTAIDRLLGTETDFGVSARNRVLDVVLLLDEVEAGRLAGGLADPDRIAVMGHSFGGFTALAVAGGYDDIAADPRVDAIVPLAPASSRLTDEALSSIGIPMLIVTGSDDATTPVEDQSTRPLELATGPATLVEIEGGSHEVVTNVCDILDAVSAPGAEVPDGTVEAAQALAGETCEPDAAVDVAQAFDITERYAVSFLRQHLADDERYEAVEPADGATVRAG
ncbi:MAG TPA: alpha/beta fold hydrolase [Acidimicrobiales bacterium]|nr:alpha/beta fold hydrolase [Acidimicrobiales bacterium]